MPTEIGFPLSTPCHMLRCLGKIYQQMAQEIRDCLEQTALHVEEELTLWNTPMAMLVKPETSFQKKWKNFRPRHNKIYNDDLWALWSTYMKFVHFERSHSEETRWKGHNRDRLTSSRLKRLTAWVCFCGWVLDYFIWWYKWVAHLCQRYHYKLWSHSKRARHSHWQTQLSICWWGLEELEICN